MNKKAKKSALLLLVGSLIIGIPLIIGSIFAAPQNLITNLDMIQVAKGAKPDGVTDHVLQANQSYNQLVNDYYLKIKWEQMAGDIKTNFPYVVKAEGSLVLGEKTEKIVVADSKDTTKTYEIGEIKAVRNPAEDISESINGSVTITFNDNVKNNDVKNMLLKGNIYVGLTTDLNSKLLESKTPTVSVVIKDTSSTINPVTKSFTLKHGSTEPSFKYEYRKSNEGSYKTYTTTWPLLAAGDVMYLRDTYTPAPGYDFYFKDMTFTFNDYALDLFSDANKTVEPTFNNKTYALNDDIFTRLSTNERRPAEWLNLVTYKNLKTKATSNWLMRIDPIVVRSENSKPIVFDYTAYVNPKYLDKDFVDSSVELRFQSGFEIKYVNTYLNEIISTAEGTSVLPDTTSVTLKFAYTDENGNTTNPIADIVYKDIPLTSDQFKSYTLSKSELEKLSGDKYVATSVNGIDTLSEDPALNIVTVNVVPYSKYPVTVTINYFYKDDDGREVKFIDPVTETPMLDSNAYKDYQIPADVLDKIDELGLIVKNKPSLPVLSQDPTENIINLELSFKDIVITFVIDDTGKTETQTLKKGDHIKQPSNPTKPDHKFVGWSTEENGSILWDFENGIVESSITLYPIFKEINKFRISFVTPDNATTVDPIYVVEGSKAIQPQNPTNPGLSFVEWCIDDTLTTKWEFNNVVTSDMTLYSSWRDAEKYTITFNPGNGSAKTTLSIAYGLKIPRPVDPVAKGYEFVGWFKNTSLTQPWNFDKDVVTGEVNLYAKWKVAPKFTVSYEDGNGKLIASKTVSKGDNLVKPTLTLPAGYTIDGWFRDKELKTEWIFDTDTVTENITLYPKWSKASYKITFNTNGGSEVSTVDVVVNELIQKPADPIYKGYTFMGWFKDNKFQTPWNFDTDKVTKATTLYAKWLLESYKITFNTNGGSTIDPISVNANKLIQKPADPTRNGFVFDGWFKDSNFKEVWNFDTDTVSNAVTLYAKWTVKTFVVTFDVNGGTPAINDQKVGLNNKVTKPVNPTKTGVIFGGWFTDSTFQTEWNFNDPLTSELKLVAKWNANTNSILTITFNTDGGSKVNVIKINYGKTITEPSKPAKKGFIFDGWYTDENLTNQWNFSTPVTSSMTLFAKWSTNSNSFKVTLDTQGGSPMDPIDVVYGSTMNEPSKPTKDGYEFVGWFKNANGVTPWNFAKDVVNSDMTLYAVWSKTDGKFTVTFETGLGTPVSPQTIVSGGLVKSPVTPRIKDNCFSGWFADKELTVRWIFSSNRIYEDTTLYAKYCY